MKNHAGTTVIALVVAVMIGTSAVLAQAPDPRARITLPVADQTVRGTAAIQGTAMSPAFSRYELAYAQEPDQTNWIAFGGAVQPVDNGQLGVWNTRPLADGNYAVRLQVFGTDGTVVETVVRNLTLTNAASSPASGASGVTTDTLEGPAVVSEVQTARDTLQVVGDTIGEMPGAFVRGGRYALIALGALCAYVLLKKLLLFAIPRLFKRRVDYGR